MMQTIIINERNLSPTNSCDLESISNIADQSGCRQLRDCKYLSGRINVCESNDPVRRYEWFSLSNGIVYGNNDTCHGPISSIGNDGSSSSDSYQCFAFHCTCLIKPSQSPRVVTAISFRNQVSDISNNKVVVSIKFVKTLSMIQIQIYEGTLMPFGRISLDQWKPLENISYDERAEKYYVTNKEGWQFPLLLGAHYAHPEIMNFDDIIAPSGSVVTGVRFRFAEDLFTYSQFKSLAIQLQIRVTPFDFVGGKLVDIDETRWIATESQNTRYELPLENPDKPTKSPKNDPDSATNEFIKFRPSDLSKDAGQTTVPFLEGQNVQILTRPIGGVGIFHRGSNGYGGYLAFKLFDVNLSKFLESDL
ncbi:uncharacterized protein LOC130672679 isoform X2 [Microplitis mediator]|nr:uncharacterized protein LOC130672679 isoform X2 [Microplitis mediator]